MADITLKEVESNIKHQINRDWGDWDEHRRKEVALSGLAEETGEVLGLRKRELRALSKDLQRCTYKDFVEELGDVLWYLVATCIEYNIPLEALWQFNKEKLEARYGK